MTVLYLLIPVALLLAGTGVAAFYWSVRSGQFDDTTTPAIRMLIDDDPACLNHRSGEMPGEVDTIEE